LTAGFALLGARAGRKHFKAGCANGKITSRGKKGKLRLARDSHETILQRASLLQFLGLAKKGIDGACKKEQALSALIRGPQKSHRVLVGAKNSRFGKSARKKGTRGKRRKKGKKTQKLVVLKRVSNREGSPN